HHSSTPGWFGIVRGEYLGVYGFLEHADLVIGEYHDERLQKHDRLTQAGIQVKVSVIQGPPIRGGRCGGATAQIGSYFAKIFADVQNHVCEGVDLVQELRTLAEQHVT